MCDGVTSIKGDEVGGRNAGLQLPEPNDRQAEVIYLDADKDQVVLGTAGSGKTLMAVHRAAYLANAQLDHGGPTLLVTFNRALASYLEHLAGAGQSQLHIRNYHQVARGYLSSRGLMGWNEILGWGDRTRAVRYAIDEAIAANGSSSPFDRPPTFFEDELDWISGNGHSSENEYLAAQRVGRLDPLQRAQRQRVWQVRSGYHARRAALGRRYDWWELPSAMRAALAVDDSPRMYRHVVIDEAQDLPPEALRSLRELIVPDGSVTLFADYAQQLYGQRTSWASCGIEVSRVEEFRENFRNSPGIAKLAIATAELPHFRDRSDLVEPTSPAVSGLQPTLYRAATRADELRVVQAQARQLGATSRVAILSRTRQPAREAARGLPFTEISDGGDWSSDPGVYVGTFYAAKGLEFDAVIMPFMDAEEMPAAAQIEAFGEAEAKERDARLVYVGITRARAELLVTYRDQLTDLLPPPSTGLWALTGARR